MKPRFEIALLGSLLVAQGCASSSSLTPANSIPATVLPASIEDHGTATVVILLPPIHEAGSPIDWSINSLSSANRSAIVKIDNKRVASIALNASNSHCVAESAGLTCTLVFTTKPGKYAEVLVETYAPHVKQPLASGHNEARYPVELKAGRNVVKIGVAEIARTIKIVPATSTLPHGQYLLDQLNYEAYDAAHLRTPTIHPISRRGRTFVVLYTYTGFSSGSLQWGSYYYQCCGEKPVFPYDGVAEGTETITGTASAGPYSDNPTFIPPATAKLTVVPGLTDFAPVMFGLTLPNEYGLQTVAQFAAASSASTAPVRQFINSFRTYISSGDSLKWPLFGEDTSGKFWAGNTHLSNSLDVLGTVTLPPSVRYPVARDYKGHLYAQGPQTASSSGCAIYEFPKGYGSLKPLRHIDGPCSSMMAADSADNLYVAGEFFVPTSNGSSYAFGVQEYPAKGSGKIAPIRTMVEARTGFSYEPQFLGLGLDDAGNVYVGAAESPYRQALYRTIYKFAPGQTTGTVQLGGLRVLGFVVDGAGDIYAEVASPTAGITEIQEFAPGATTPMQTFGGTTGLSYGLPILLPRYPP